MKKILLFIILPVSLGIALALKAMEGAPHDFAKADCALCHQIDFQGNIMGTGDRITPLCESCHEDLFKTGYMHPVDVYPQNVNIPDDMPLTDDGLLTCNTCHDVHSAVETPSGAPSYFLRRGKRGREFCTTCHGTTISAGSHQVVLGEAHFQSKYIAADPFSECDPMSINCMSCHDGSIGGIVTVRTGVWIHQQTSLAGFHDKEGHPICFDYDSVQSRPGRKTDLRPRGMIDMRIQFFNGIMGCGSCHHPFHMQDDYLLIVNRGSELCFACHQVDE